MCRPTSHHTTRLLANLTLPPSQTISVNALYSLEGLQSSRGLLALCQPAHTDNSSQEPVTAKAGILVLWRVPTSVRARSPLQLRGPPAALDPTRTWSFSELGLTAGSHEGLNPELVHSTADSVHLTVLTTVPGMRMPAVILGGPSGICCLAFSTQTASAGEKPDLKAHVTMRGSCPPGAGALFFADLLYVTLQCGHWRGRAQPSVEIVCISLKAAVALTVWLTGSQSLLSPLEMLHHFLDLSVH